MLKTLQRKLFEPGGLYSHIAECNRFIPTMGEDISHR